MKNRSFLFFLLFLVSIVCSSCQAQADNTISQSPFPAYPANEKPQQLDKFDASLSGSPLKIMLARTSAERSLGLMYYDSLPENEGMLFVYSSPRVMSFWMCNTKIPLDIVFFSDQLQVTEWIESMEPGYGKDPELLPRYVSKAPAQYALELNAGAIKKMGIKAGDRLDIPLTLLYSD
ncbi:MAG: hypothetical protein Kow0029_10370 [Candidatus Rifleibacteriota bacterium]